MAPQPRHTPAIATDETIRKGLAAYGMKAEGMVGPPCLLTYPQIDLEGDWVEPDGGRWVDRPFVNFDHQHPIGWANGLPKMKSLNVAGTVYNVPIGQTRFFKSLKDIEGADLSIRDAQGEPTGKFYKPAECLHLAKQVHQLVGNDLVNGTSLEFKSLHAERIGKSALRGRSAWNHTEWIGLGWAHTAQPVNPGARTIEEDVVLKALGVSDLHPLIRKSFAFAPHRVSVRGGYVPEETTMARVNKAMPEDEEDTGEEYAADDDLGEGDGMGNEDMPEGGMEEEGMGGDEPPTAVKELLQVSQMLTDLANQHEEGMKRSDNVKARKYAAKCKAKILKLAAEAQAYSEEIANDLNMGGDDTDEPDGDEDMEGDEPEEMPDEPETDDDGAITSKSFRHYKSRRLKLSMFGPPVKKARRKDADKFVEVPRDQWDAIQKYVNQID